MFLKKVLVLIQAHAIVQLFSPYFFKGIPAVVILKTGCAQLGMTFHCFVNRCQSFLILMSDI